MNISKEHIDWFDQYQSGTLSEQERLDFELQLKNNSDLKKEFDFYSLFVEGIQIHARQELKSLLKEKGKVMYFGENIWSKTMKYASVAVFLIFGGLYAFIHFYLEPKQKTELAIEPKKEIQSPIDEQKSISEPNIINEKDLAIKTPSIEIAPLEKAEEALKETMQESEEAFADDELSKELMSKAKDANEEKDNYQIAVEKKLKDTLVDAQLIAQVDFSKKYENKLSPKKKSIILPQNSNIPQNNNQILFDSMEVKNKKTVSKARKNNSTNSYRVEFWQSPINFKGYKMVNNTIQLYGLNVNQSFELKNYNNQLYFIQNNKVYKINQCIDACAFQFEVDEEIIDLLMN